MATEEKTGKDEFTVGESAETGILTPLAGLYWNMARGHLLSARDAKFDPLYERPHSLATVLLAVAALEAYIPEIVNLDVTRWPIPVVRNPATQAYDRDILLKALKEWGKRRRKIENVYAVPAPEEARRQPWYNRCKCLRMLRNAFTHYEAKVRPFRKWPDLLEENDCLALIQGISSQNLSWTNASLNANVATWSCETVLATVSWFHSKAGGIVPWSEELSPGDRWLPLFQMNGP